MRKVRRVDAVLWLAEMKEKGRARLKALGKEYNAGKLPKYTLDNAQHKQAMIELLLKIFQACPVDLDELTEEIQRMKAPQRSLFNDPKNPI